MSQSINQQSLLLLLNCPKKKYIKHLIEYSACLNLTHNSPPKHLKTPLIQTFQSDLKLTTEQSHKLLHALADLIDVACAIGFDFESHQVFSEEFDQQLKAVLVSTIAGMQAEIQEARLGGMKIGNKLVDIDWKIDQQIANQKGKTNVPNVTVQIESLRDSQMQVDKFQMRGEQFLAFFGNMKKIKENLLQLVQRGS